MRRSAACLSYNCNTASSCEGSSPCAYSSRFFWLKLLLLYLRPSSTHSSLGLHTRSYHHRYRNADELLLLCHRNPAQDLRLLNIVVTNVSHDPYLVEDHGHSRFIKYRSSPICLPQILKGEFLMYLIQILQRR
jgi:hypothetical protein